MVIEDEREPKTTNLINVLSQPTSPEVPKSRSPSKQVVDPWHVAESAVLIMLVNGVPPLPISGRNALAGISSYYSSFLIN